MTQTPLHKRYALILAGGSGQRFWPISRDALPKQLLKLFGEKTLLELTIERLDGFVPKENILILTNQQQEASVRAIPLKTCPLKTSSLSRKSVIPRPPSPSPLAGLLLVTRWPPCSCCQPII
jgi:molybdopterin-guanine dinucleotide biosynthesis protein A